MQIILTPDNIVSYLGGRGILDLNEKVRVTPLGGGLINTIFLIQTQRKQFVVKQALKSASFKKDITLSPIRIITENNALNVWKKRTQSESIPCVIYCDAQNFILVMEAVPQQYELLTYALISGNVNLAIARGIGKLLGAMHNSTYHDKRLKKLFPISEPFRKLKMGLYHKELILSTNNTTIKKNIAAAVQRCYKNKIALIHGDVLPKNILVNGNHFYLLDYECVCMSDPSHDLGTIIAHYLLPAIINYPKRKQYYTAINALLEEYSRTISFKQILKKVKTNAIAHIAPTLYGRVFGAPQIDFVDEKTKDVIKRIINTLAGNDYSNINKVFLIIDTEGRTLTKNKPLTKKDVEGSRLF